MNPKICKKYLISLIKFYLQNYFSFDELNNLNNMQKKDLIEIIKQKWAGLPWGILNRLGSNQLSFENLIKIIKLKHIIKCPSCGYDMQYFYPQDSLPKELTLNKLRLPHNHLFQINEIDIICSCEACYKYYYDRIPF